ncbi:MAG TPA: protein-L-isoaspartate(D-aspartate) O-methyltransferase [Candidatus Sulfotelmatobacter sp.]|jgi:protein-L-isoaspartate(D-aspartate) O-methyltransferase|nr:protein-L-isoaspartate(D-aspartate) O-methyltransferase [Candidatus Sulfotelmatobacter sp.]
MASFPHGNDSAERYAEDRRLMIENQIRKRGVTNERVLSAIAAVPRHEFLPPFWINRAYADEPLPIGHGQTISQPYMVAAMVAALSLAGAENVLEIGTGCGYQAAVLSLLAREVHTVELLPDLAQSAAERLQRLGYANVQVHAGDGTLGWIAQSPYNAILIAAAAPSIPEPLLQQLAEGGRLIAPVGDLDKQELQVIIRREGKSLSKPGGACRFVPLMGEYGWRK